MQIYHKYQVILYILLIETAITWRALELFHAPQNKDLLVDILSIDCRWRVWADTLYRLTRLHRVWCPRGCRSEDPETGEAAEPLGRGEERRVEGEVVPSLGAAADQAGEDGGGGGEAAPMWQRRILLTIRDVSGGNK